MNKKIENPYIIDLIQGEKNVPVQQNGRRAYIPYNLSWPEFVNALAPIQSDRYDSVLVHIDKRIPLNDKGVAKNLDIKMNQVNKFATGAEKPVLNDAYDGVWYWMNPSYEDQSKAHGYAPSDDTVMEKYNRYGSDMKWQEHQAHVWSRMADMMPLAHGEYKGAPNHEAQLTAPNRGLEKKDLGEFWSFRSGKILSPTLMGDDMVGMPGIVGQDYDGFTMVPQKGPNAGQEQPIAVRSLKTVGMSGIAIPMNNVEGNCPKYQIATDPSKINVMLKAKAADGVSIQKSEYFNKKTNEYKFTQDGKPSGLHVENVTIDGTATFQDRRGTFQAKMKDDVTQVLKDRGYELPPMMEKLQVVPNAKYIWQSKGTMVGSDEVSKVVSPSNAGFVVAREPKNGKSDYVTLVAEGALKGRIVAKYVDVKDKNGTSFGDTIAGDHGIIVAQVPGVSKAFVESVKPVYDAYPIYGTYIAMDADGRDNLAVCNGIHTAYHCLEEKSQVKVMSWDPAQKGLDDALLAVAQGKITLDDMKLHYGPPEKLFPKDQAKAPNPYKLDGTRANRQSWQIEYAESSKATNSKIHAIQEETKRRAAENLKKEQTQSLADQIKAGGKDLADALPSKDPKQGLVPE